MERRRAVIAAATASLTLLAGAAAISLNTGIVGASGDDGPGQVSPVDGASTPPTTIYLDEPAAADQTTTSEAPSLAPGASRSGDDDGYESESDEGEKEDDRSPGDDYEYEYEGADDDD
jgi:hypothetical protein